MDKKDKKRIRNIVIIILIIIIIILLLQKCSGGGNRDLVREMQPPSPIVGDTNFVVGIYDEPVKSKNVNAQMSSNTEGVITASLSKDNPEENVVFKLENKSLDLKANVSASISYDSSPQDNEYNCETYFNIIVPDKFDFLSSGDYVDVPIKISLKKIPNVDKTCIFHYKIEATPVME